MNPSHKLLSVCARPCDTCCFRTDRTYQPHHVEPLIRSMGLEGDPFLCPEDPAKLCAGWVVTAWRSNRTILQAVQQRRVLLTDLMAAKGWPALHETVSAVLQAAVPAQRVGVEDGRLAPESSR